MRTQRIRPVWIALLGCVSVAHASTFYIDAKAGKDTNPGTSANDAWSTLEPVSAHKFKPGDRILFHAGQSAPKNRLPIGKW